ncbi:collagen alpha-2(I) chain-like [Pteropus vampyrus]|uniref:Collagen alpha-2(I) chain-like n=1 Tax=Pteropus vampyrus TaxID=132908 RepID=A0A6P6CY61_PTEVA|nr:collagen alpha-2(I) chain-like [Pteropus vampyrus]
MQGQGVSPALWPREVTLSQWPRLRVGRGRGWPAGPPVPASPGGWPGQRVDSWPSRHASWSRGEAARGQPALGRAAGGGVSCPACPTGPPGASCCPLGRNEEAEAQGGRGAGGICTCGTSTERSENTQAGAALPQHLTRLLPAPNQLCDRLLPGPQAPGLRPQSPLRLCPGLLSPRQVGRGMHLLGHMRGKVESGPGFRWPPGNWPETGVPFTSAGKDTEAGDLETEAGHWPSKAGHWPLPLMPLAPVLDATLPPSAPLPGTLGLGPSLQIHHRPRPAPSGRAGWQVFWSAPGQSASRSRRVPCAQ